METKHVSKNKKWRKVFLGISAATIVAAGATVGICCAIWHKQKNPTPLERDLFFTTEDTTTTPNSTKAFYGTISAANFTLCADTNLKVKVDGAVSSDWTAITFDNKTHIKIAPPNSLSAGEKFQISIYDSQNDITSNAIGFSVQTKMSVDNGYYVAIKNDGTVSKTAVTATVSLSSQSLVGLYFGQNSIVTTLNCSSNQLQQLDVSNNSQLKFLDCRSNQLTSLDVSKNTKLQSLECGSNQLTQLDVSGNSKLTDLYCYSNQLTQLDVPHNSQLTTLYCYSNQLTQLDVSNNPQLTSLDCSSNKLQQLDVSNTSLQERLDCRSNQLTQLDVSGNSNLTILFCYRNPLNLIKLPTNKTTGIFTFASSGTLDEWTATDYADSGDIYYSSGLFINGLPATWTRHNS